MATEPISNTEDHRELVQVFDTSEETEAMVVQGLLESAGIESLITGLDAPQDILPGVGGVVVRVPAEMADQARMLIEEYRSDNEAEMAEQDRSDAADENTSA
jgi:putative signal transducing protein